MNFLIMDALGVLSLVKTVVGTPLLSVAIEPFSNLGTGVELKVRFLATDQDLDRDSLKLELIFIDQSTGDQIFSFIGSVDPDLNNYSSLAAIIDATEEFQTFEIETQQGFFDAVKVCDAFNAVDTLARNSVTLDWVSDTPVQDISKLHDILTQSTNKPTRLYMYFNDNVPPPPSQYQDVPSLNFLSQLKKSTPRLT